MAAVPIYLGAEEVQGVCLGADEVLEAYLGEDLVYQAGPFAGLRVSPKVLSFNSGSLTSSIKVKSSESWTMTVPAWISADVLTGDTGETIVSLTATAQTATTTGAVEVVSANYSASATVNYYNVEFVDYIHSSSMGDNKGNYLSTTIVPDNTMYGVFKGKKLGYQTGMALVGQADAPDNNDWRFFTFNSLETYMDVHGGRCSGKIGISNNAVFEVEFGNLYVKNLLTSQQVTGVTQTGSFINSPISIDMGVVWVESLALYSNGTLVFNGKAAKMGSEYGLFDEVSGNFLTSNDFTIVGETVS